MRSPIAPLRTKLVPPRTHRRVLARPALAARLHEALDYRVTLIHAGTGYGKTTALAALHPPGGLVCWYSLEEADSDPQRFLAHLCAAVEVHLPGVADPSRAILLERGDQGGRETWCAALDALINVLADQLTAPAILVLDDYHAVAGSTEVVALIERLVTFLPPALHLVVASRHPLMCDAMVRARARGELLELDRRDLAFDAAEIERLFAETYGVRLSEPEVAALLARTQGWPIALHLVGQGLRGGHGRSAADLLAGSPAPLAALFDYLARDLFARQPPEIRTFLYETAVLRTLTAEACDAVRAEPGVSAGLLARLHDLDLFVMSVGEGFYRYHPLFHEFLRQLAGAEPGEVRARHQRAGQFYTVAHDHEEALFHWLAAGEYRAAARAIEAAAEAALAAGRVDAVAGWIGALPADVVAEHPRLQAYMGDVCRLRSGFDEALAWYAQAEHTWRARADMAGAARALRGQARVYLDTVRPAEAERLLAEAQRITDGTADREARARLLELLAENKLNLGRPDDAERLRAEAWALRSEGPGEDAVSVRVKLRTGRLDEAERILRDWDAAERQGAARGQSHPPRGHRETVLLLSLIHAFRGQGQAAFDLAQEGIALGERLGSPFVTAVAHTRMGHAWQVRGAGSSPDPQARDEAVRCYQAAIALGDRLAVRRVRLEAMWGLTRAHGLGGELEAARRAAAEGVELGSWSGDQWVQSLVELALGSSLMLAGQLREALDLLTRVLAAFRACGDHFGAAATRLWMCLAYLDTSQRASFDSCVAELLTACEQGGYDFLFTAPSLLGPPDPRRLVPMLVLARDRRINTSYAARVLAEIGLAGVETHPGYQLRVYTLGRFRVLRGTHEVDPREWQRDKARQLFQLFVTHRGSRLQRDEIVELLWPQLGPEAAGRDFKVALNALNKALEPGRAPDAPFSYVVRDGSTYQLRPNADLWLDAAEFERAAEAGLRQGNADPATVMARLQAALALYTGDFLPDALYEDWASAERERLLSLMLRVADRLAGLLLEHNDIDAALDVCGAILARDPCWERAYRLMMRSYAQQGNRPQALRLYQRCVRVLHEQLGVEPSAATTALYNQIVRAGR